MPLPTNIYIKITNVLVYFVSTLSVLDERCQEVYLNSVSVIFPVVYVHTHVFVFVFDIVIHSLID